MRILIVQYAGDYREAVQRFMAGKMKPTTPKNIRLIQLQRLVHELRKLPFSAVKPNSPMTNACQMV